MCCRWIEHDFIFVLQEVHIFCEWWQEKKSGTDAAGIVQCRQIHEVIKASSRQLRKLGCDVFLSANSNLAQAAACSVRFHAIVLPAATKHASPHKVRAFILSCLFLTPWLMHFCRLAPTML